MSGRSRKSLNPHQRQSRAGKREPAVGRRAEPEEVQDDFRLWITCEPHPRFPIGLLQMSIKITNEAPVGLRAGLKGSYYWINQDMLDTVSQPQWRTMRKNRW